MALVLDGNGTMTVGNGDITGLVAGALPSTVIGAGAVLQVVQATYGTNALSITSTYADTGLTATITPTSATSKILVIVYQGQCTKSAFDTQLNVRIVRGSDAILTATSMNPGTATALATNITLTYLDSPATTSSTTYKTQFANRDSAGTVAVNSNGTATMILMEIAA